MIAKRGDLRIVEAHEPAGVRVQRSGSDLHLDAAELRWLVFVAGPAALTRIDRRTIDDPTKRRQRGPEAEQAEAE